MTGSGWTELLPAGALATLEADMFVHLMVPSRARRRLSQLLELIPE